jgi:hypothetical protein
MTTSNETVRLEQTPGRWQSLLSSIADFARALDHDPHEQAAISLEKLGETVSQLEGRLAVLEARQAGRVGL